MANLSERRQLFGNANGRVSKLLILTEGVVPYLSIPLRDIARRVRLLYPRSAGTGAVTALA